MHVVRSIAPAVRAFAIRVLIVLIGAGATALIARPATAQNVVAFVNGEPITTLDIEQRSRFLQMISRRTPSRQEALEEIVNEKIKLQQAVRLKITITDAEVDRTFAAVAQQNRRTIAEYNAALKQSGVDPRLFKDKLRADLAWRRVLQQTTPGAFFVRDADIVAELTARGKRETGKAMQYTLRQFVFVVPRGSPATAHTARAREADALRARFTSCEEGVQLAREFREVVIKDAVVRISTDLPERFQKLLEQTADGRMTPPEPTATGIEVVAVCDRKETIADVTSQRDVKERLLSGRVQAEEKSLLEQLRRQSIIEYR
jgi:peptidyl-prolyl cis-trans isomerase SurA